MDKLFDYTSFRAPGQGQGWSSFLVNISIICNFVTTLTGISISISLLYLWLYRRKEIPAPFIYLTFAIAVLLGALIHLLYMVRFYYPMYRLLVLFELIQSTFSIMTALILPFNVIYLMKLPSFNELYTLNNSLIKEVALRKKQSTKILNYTKKLKLHVTQLESELSTNKFLIDSSKSLKELIETIDSFKTSDSSMHPT